MSEMLNAENFAALIQNLNAMLLQWVEALVRQRQRDSKRTLPDRAILTLLTNILRTSDAPGAALVPDTQINAA